jgi:hypothetical protein
MNQPSRFTERPTTGVEIDDVNEFCENCETVTPFVVYGFENERWAECQMAGCDYSIDLDPEEPDPDLLHDSRIDRQ